MRQIGSKTSTVRQNYISYKLLLQMEKQEGISLEQVENKFSVLYLSLRAAGVQQYLQIDVQADPASATNPVPEDHLKQLDNFARWLFGDEKRPPLFTDSRLVDDFGKILESPVAVGHLEGSDRPNFDYAFRLAGGDEEEIIKLVQDAANNIELALSRAHLHTNSESLQKAVERFGRDALQILRVFPTIRDQLMRDEK